MSPKVQINISEEYKAFFWSPMKTSSMHANMVFTLFGFEYFLCSYDRKNIFLYEEFPRHTNHSDLFEGHEEYQLISTARNPIHRFFSSYLYFNKNTTISVKGFREYFSTQVNNNNFILLHSLDYNQRMPDYFVRVENLFEDYTKIPFINQSKINSCGALKELCERKKNYSNQNLNVKEFYTSDMIDYLYENNKIYFKLLGYEPIL